VGYACAGFEVVGVDNRPQPRFPFEFHQTDALLYLAEHGHEFDFIHASPPCQAYSAATYSAATYSAATYSAAHCRAKHPDMVGSTRLLLCNFDVPWVIENVPGAPLGPSIMLCGLMFGLKVFRHRWFESNRLLLAPSHPGHRGRLIGVGGMSSVVGHGGGPNAVTRKRMRSNGNRDTKQDWEAAMGIDWMIRDELSQAIPPAYTEFIGRQLIGR
jgi:DNA (cytosine-5)-methyltransferase 1